MVNESKKESEMKLLLIFLTLIITASPIFAAKVTIAGPEYGAPKSNSSILYRRDYHQRTIIFFHGTGGSAASLDQSSMTKAFIEAAYASFFNVLIIDSSNRRQKQWNTFKDAEQVENLIDYLKRKKLLRKNEVFYGLGISNGGGFVTNFALLQKKNNSSVVKLNAYATMIAARPESFYQQHKEHLVPAIFINAENDSLIKKGSVDVVKESSAYHLKRGIPSEVHVSQERKLYLDSMASIKGINKKSSEEIYNTLRTNSCLRWNSKLAFNPRTDGGTCLSTLLPKFQSQQKEIRKKLSTIYAEHSFIEDKTPEILNFFTKN
jgi:predicted esterase